ncbi:hypothetical protein [Streptomyces sp. NPDC017520]|uniref:hypothetical protein n=1 Tax=Streptomyces sp. NPDC017520 TaxID=3364998 RepID=UPI0037873C77
MAWDEWEQLKSEAAQRSSASTQLNGVPPGGGTTGTGDLTVHDDELGRMGNTAYELRQKFGVDSDLARPGTFAASIDLFNDGLDMGAALTELHDAWNSQTKTLKDACAHISNHFDYSRAQHAKDQVQVATSMPVSKIDSYIK